MIKIKYFIFTALTVFLLSCSDDVAVRPAKQVRLKSTGSWQMLDDSGFDVGAGGWNKPSTISLRGVGLYIIGTDNQGSGNGIYKFTGGTGNWMKLDGAALKIAVDGYGKPWVINAYLQLFRRTSANQWQSLPGAAIDIAVGGPLNIACIIGTDSGIYYWYESTKTWVKKWTVPNASRVAVDATGTPWVVTSDRLLLRKKPFPDLTNWQLVGTNVYDVGAGADGSVFMTTTEGILNKWTGNGWDQWDQVDGLAREVTVDIWGRPIVLNDQNLIYQNL